MSKAIGGRQAAEPRVAVVTPVYNGARYLEQCIESVLAQSYSNWRYLIADNCSTDETLAIAQAYAARDDRIRVHRFESFETVIRNWNRTLLELDQDCAYVKFVLADDWLYPDCLASMVELAVREPSVGVVGAYRIIGTHVDLDWLPPEVEIVPGREICRHHLLGGEYILGSPTSLLFRADLVRERAPEFFYEARLDGRDDAFVNFHGDTDACLALLEKSDLGFVHQVLTYTRLHEASITRQWTGSRGTWLPGHLLTLLRHGTEVLPRKELESRVRHVRHRYEALLVRSAVKGRLRDPSFRAYHAAAIARIRVQLRSAGVRGGIWLAFLGLFLGG